MLQHRTHKVSYAEVKELLQKRKSCRRVRGVGDLFVYLRALPEKQRYCVEKYRKKQKTHKINTLF